MLGSFPEANPEPFCIEIKQNNISVIYTMKPLDRHFLNELLGDKCLKSSSLNSILDEHLILECDNLKMN